MFDIHQIDVTDRSIEAALQDVPRSLQVVLPRFARLFSITSHLAPGLHMIGGELLLDKDDQIAAGTVTVSATGTGTRLSEALTACVGEAAELLSQFERPGDVALTCARSALSPGQTGMLSGWIAGALEDTGSVSAIDWTAAFDADGQQTHRVPTDICFRRPPARRAVPLVGALSSGCAAGADQEMATQRALLELIERDAAALWWFGGRPPRELPAAGTMLTVANALNRDLRRGVEERHTSLLDITTDLTVPVMAAVSVDRRGRGLACGLAARLDPTEALCAAIRELCQMELSAPLAELKMQARGVAALNEADRRHLLRARFDTSDCELLRPRADNSPPLPTTSSASSAPGGASSWVASMASKIKLATLDLTRADLGVPVARVLSPDLQPFVPMPRSRRLDAALNQFGGGLGARHNLPLM